MTFMPFCRLMDMDAFPFWLSLWSEMAFLWVILILVIKDDIEK